MKKLINKIMNGSKRLISVILNITAYLLLVFSFIVYKWEVNTNSFIPTMKKTILIIMITSIIICITRLLLKKYIKFAIISFAILSYTIKAIPLVKIISNGEYVNYSYFKLNDFRYSLGDFEGNSMKNILMIILAVEVFSLIIKIAYNYLLLTNIPNNTTNRTHNSRTNNHYSDSEDNYYSPNNRFDYYNNNYHNKGVFNNNKFNSQHVSEHVGTDNYGREIYKESSTGKYVTVEKYSNEIIDESYNKPYGIDDNTYNYNNDYDYYNNNDNNYVEHNYGFDGYDNYSDYYADSLNSYLYDND